MHSVMKCWQVIFIFCVCCSRAKLNLAGCSCASSWVTSCMGLKQCYWQNGWVENQILLLLQNSQARMKWQWFKCTLDRPYVPYSEMKWCCRSVLLSIRTTAPASRTAGRSPTCKKSALPLSFKSHLGVKPMSVPACLMLEQDTLGKHTWYKGEDIINNNNFIIIISTLCVTKF